MGQAPHDAPFPLQTNVAVGEYGGDDADEAVDDVANGPDDPKVPWTHLQLRKTMSRVPTAEYRRQ